MSSVIVKTCATVWREWEGSSIGVSKEVGPCYVSGDVGHREPWPVNTFNSQLILHSVLCYCLLDLDTCSLRNLLRYSPNGKYFSCLDICTANVRKVCESLVFPKAVIGREYVFMFSCNITHFRVTVSIKRLQLVWKVAPTCCTLGVSNVPHSLIGGHCEGCRTVFYLRNF